MIRYDLKALKHSLAPMKVLERNVAQVFALQKISGNSGNYLTVAIRGWICQISQSGDYSFFLWPRSIICFKWKISS